MAAEQSLVDNPPPDDEWLARGVIEAVIEPDLPIIDAHHHLWDGFPWRYDAADYLADVATGHHIVGNVVVEGGGYYRTHGPEELRSVGEIEAAASAAYPFSCTAIVGFADASASALFSDVLTELVCAADGKLRGIRYSAASHPIGAYRGRTANRAAGLLRHPGVAASVDMLGDRGLVFETWLLFEQLDELAELAAKCPGTIIVLDHLGGPLAVGQYLQDAPRYRTMWERSLAKLAEYPNLRLKLGGLGMTALGATFRQRATPPRSEELADAWAPLVMRAIDIFGAERCMFESNFPVDKGQLGWRALWNAYKIITAPLPSGDRMQLFAGTAARTYAMIDCK